MESFWLFMIDLVVGLILDVVLFIVFLFAFLFGFTMQGALTGWSDLPSALDVAIYLCTTCPIFCLSISSGDSPQFLLESSLSSSTMDPKADQSA